MSTISASTTLTTAYAVTGDTTGALVFKTGASPTTAMTLGADQSVTFAGAVNTTGNQTVTGNLTVNGNTTVGDASTDTATVNATTTFAAYPNLPNTFGFKNRIINGAMVIDQRNAGASYAQSTSAIYGLDRWKTDIDYSSGRWDVQQVSDAPTGFTKSLKVTITTQEAQPASALNQVYQIIEGYNVADLAFGTASASTIAVSFWVKASVTGTYSLNVFSVDYGYTTSYVVNSANTWEFKTVTIAGATAGTWATGNTSSMYLEFTIGGGTSQIRTANTWGALTEAGIVSGSVYLPATSGATWQVTGVQLEKGSTATSFDFRSYGTELALCQRYYEVIGNGNQSIVVGGSSTAANWIAYASFSFAVPKRSNPTMTIVGSWTNLNAKNHSAVEGGLWGFRSYVESVASGAFYVQNSGGSTYTASAEL